MTKTFPVTGDLISSNQSVGLASPTLNSLANFAEQFKGHLDEVRIWSVARTEEQIQDNMKDLPNPTSQPGLLAYYKFEGNSENVQGNHAFDAVPAGNPVIEPWTAPASVKPFTVTTSVTQPSCNVNNGSIQVYGSGGPMFSSYVYSLDGGPFQPTHSFDNLAPGTHTLFIRSDAPQYNGCSKTMTITLTSPCAPATVTTSFTAPDTVCVNTPINITNTSTGATTYFWNFCVANVNTPPTGVNMNNIGGNFHSPVYIDYAYDNGNYYGFMVNNYPGGLLRLNFGNSLLNTPTVTDLGTVGGVIPNNAEGVQVVKNEGQWYVIVVGGNPAGNVPSAIVKVTLGANIANNAPAGTYWGNIGGLNYPHDLYVFDDNGHWYGLTVNTSNNTITRFDFTTSFSNVPTGVNLGNIGSLTAPTGIFAIKDNGNWYGFVTNANSSTLTRLDFGSSLLNTPAGTNLGNIGGAFNTCWDIYIMKFCGQNTGFLLNAGSNELLRLDFGGSIANVPSVSSYGNVGNLNFPHCISRVFRDGADLYTFIPNVSNNSLSRLRFAGCTGSSIPNSTAQNPPAIVYNAPGTYNINLTTDDGLPTQNAYCRQVVVLSTLPHVPTQQISLCPGSAIRIGASIKPATYLWNTGATTDSIDASAPGTYWVQTSRGGCSVRDSFIISNPARPGIDFGFTQNTCDPLTVQFTSVLSAVTSYQWNFGDNGISTASQSPSHTYGAYGLYPVRLKYRYGSNCIDSVDKTIAVTNVFDATLLSNSDTTICFGDSVLVRSNASLIDYCGHSSAAPGTLAVNTYVKPVAHTVYSISARVGGPNLVTNGDFSAGNTGFNSGYVSTFPNTNEGQYWVGTNPSTWNGGMSNCTGPGGSGNILMVNGSPATDVTVWSQTVTVAPNTNYDFSVWISSLTASNPAQLQFSINGINLGNAIVAGGTTCRWDRFSSTWNSGSSTTAAIAVVNRNTIAAGNDFALDDIRFSTVAMRNDSFTVDVTGYCDSIRLTGRDKVCSPLDTVTYKIYHSAQCTQNYTPTVDNSFATIVAQTPDSMRIVFRHNGSSTIHVSFSNSCKVVEDSIKVNVLFSPTSIAFGPDIVTCSDTSFVLHAGPGFGTYTWQDGTTDSVYSVQGPGQYRVTAQNICGLTLADTLVLTKVFPRPFAVTPLSARVCLGDSVLFKASGSTVYSWSPRASFAHPDAPATKALVDASQDFTLAISDDVCRRDTFITIPVTASFVGPLSVTKSNDVNCANDSAVLRTTGAGSYTWTPNVYITRSSAGSVTVKPPQTITYHVEGRNDIGCVREDSVTVYFTKDGEQKLYVPDAFTPNGDGLNDLFRPIFTGAAAQYDFRIYNRWGQLVFRSRTPGVGWDGRSGSLPQPNGAYVYYITAEGSCNRRFEQRGTFVLIR